MELYIIRHGQSANNALPDDTGRVHDPALTALGQRQAEALADHLLQGINPDPVITSPHTGQTQPNRRSGYGISHLYTSAMYRSLQTSAPIARALGLAPQVWVDIHENGGIYLDHEERGRVGYPGKTRAEILSEFAGYVLPAEITDLGWWNKDYEELTACQIRAAKVARQLREWGFGQYAGERVAMVTHGTFIDTLLKALLNQGDANGHYHWHYNTGVTRLDFVRQDFIVVRYINRIDHLPPDLIS